jgi:hypothetical protein
MANSRDRRRLRRMLAEAGLLLLPKTPVPPPAMPTHSRLSILSKVPKSTYALVVAIATVVGLLVLYPWLSIEQDFSSNTSNPFTENFSITNEGYVSAKHIYMRCVRSFDVGTGHIGNVSEEPDRTMLTESLPYKHKLSLPCTPHEFIVTDPLPYRNGTFTIVIWYEIGWVPFERAQVFKFQLVTDEAGKYHWLYAG